MAAGVELREDEGPTPGGRVRLTHSSGAAVELTRFGAHIVSWTAAAPGRPHPPIERLWMSSLSALDGTAPIRGGIPIAWPQFADVGPLPLHGFARELQWALVTPPGPAPADAATVRAELQLSSSAQTKEGTWRRPAVAPFPWDFTLRYAIELCEESLSLELTVAHVGAPVASPSVPLQFTACLHTYFRTADYEQVRLEGGGMCGASFIDKVDSLARKLEHAHPLSLVPAATESGGYVDRVYMRPSPAPALAPMLLDVGAGLDGATPAVRSVYEVRMSDAWPDFVVFNPGLDGKRGDKGPDFDDDGYKSMVCLEPAVAVAPVVLRPGGEWVGSCVIRIVA
ncbi:hypothetical protein KFE25_002864 [Diacronema lutheri]|uniref:glucose-6-phosphate 1-epimerase n=1 Tax=Diacronema lutheri TaxID=2081491 RepID=A0A8J5XP38_DIALT|nr:hypothetical protein KFE25_002864 [Diacronema lutheri]